MSMVLYIAREICVNENEQLNHRFIDIHRSQEYSEKCSASGRREMGSTGEPRSEEKGLKRTAAPAVRSCSPQISHAELTNDCAFAFRLGTPRALRARLWYTDTESYAVQDG